MRTSLPILPAHSQYSCAGLTSRPCTGRGTARKRESLLDNVEPAGDGGDGEPAWNPWAAPADRLNGSQRGAEPQAGADIAGREHAGNSAVPRQQSTSASDQPEGWPAARRRSRAERGGWRTQPSSRVPPEAAEPPAEDASAGAAAGGRGWPDGGEAADGAEQPAADLNGWGDGAPGEPGDWGWGAGGPATAAGSAPGSAPWPRGASGNGSQAAGGAGWDGAGPGADWGSGAGSPGGAQGTGREGGADGGAGAGFEEDAGPDEGAGAWAGGWRAGSELGADGPDVTELLVDEVVSGGRTCASIRSCASYTIEFALIR